MTFSDAWLADVLARPGYGVVGAPTPPVAITLPALLTATPERSPYWPYRSKTELLYATLLDQWQQAGMILRWRYEALRLTLAPRTTLTVDFLVTMPEASPDPRLHLHEIKAEYIREKGLIKLKQAAALYPEFRFVLAQRKDQHWFWKDIPAA